MRILTLALIALLFTNSLAAKEEPPLAMFYVGDVSCGAWVQSADNEMGRAQYIAWFRGFISGYNFGNPKNQVLLGSMPDSGTLVLYVDKYCRENPLKPFVGAAMDLVREVREEPKDE